MLLRNDKPVGVHPRIQLERNYIDLVKKPVFEGELAELRWGYGGVTVGLRRGYGGVTEVVGGGTVKQRPARVPSPYLALFYQPDTLP